MKTQDLAPKQSKSVKQSEDDSALNQIFRQIFSDKGLLTIVLAAIAYFFGWRFLYFYYLNFGLDTMFLSFSPIDVFSAGWRIYTMVAFLILTAIFLMWVVQKLVHTSLESRAIRMVVVLFHVFLVISFLLAIVVVYLFIIGPAKATLGFHILAYICLLSLWIAYTVGNQVYQVVKKEKNQRQIFSLFGITFPNPVFWPIVIFIGFTITTAFLSSNLGWRQYMRDREESSSRLPIATFYTNEQLDISNGKYLREDTWAYDDLRFLYKTNDLYFAFRPEEIDEEGVYVIPQKYVVSLKLHGWYYRNSHPLDVKINESAP